MNLLLLLLLPVVAVVVGSCPVWLFTRLFSLFLYSFLCCLFFRYIYLISQHCVGAGRRGTVLVLGLVRRALAYNSKFLFLEMISNASQGVINIRVNKSNQIQFIRAAAAKSGPGPCSNYN